ncbi:nuclear transport factor 2 family protein [Actinoallomurus sp. CA-150999]|uniref:nuclear transport factor 2 family protein n=1 Tax=Actinoallomurus sp. CA-150999 TaxID=3239887 RepID=UPI003D93D3DB
MTEMTAAKTSTIDPERIVGRYVAVWSEPDPESRRRAIAGLWAPGGVEFVEGVQFRGHEELHARITEAHRQFVESGEYAVTSADDVTVHGDIVTLTVQLIPPGGDEAAWAARVFLILDEDGLIRQDYHLTVKPLAAQ